MNPPAANNHSGVSVQVRGLRKSFGGQEVLKGLNFDVHPGEIFVLMGPSGSGKTVMLKHLIGLEAPDSWKASLFLNNAFNKIGETALPVAIAADLPTTRRIAVNTPRTVGILLQYAF